MQTITIRPRLIGRALCLATALLVLASLAAQVSIHVLDHDSVFGLVPLFNLDGETTLPAWYTSAVMLFCALLLAIITAVRWKAGDRFRWHWAGLALGFLYFSADEAVGFHELLIVPVRSAMNAGGLFHVAWVIPALAFVFLAGLAYLPFLRGLPREVGRLVAASAALYLAGALGAEMVGGMWIDRFGLANPVYVAIMTLEESLEMLGLAAFAYALLRYLQSHVGSVVLRVADGEECVARPAAAEPATVSAPVRRVRATAG